MPSAPPPPSAPRPTGPVAGGGAQGLEIGVTETNPNLVWSRVERPRVPAGFGLWRDRLIALHPQLFRLVVDWGKLQPSPASPPDFEALDAGCMRAVGPCAPYRGLRERLRALRSLQLAQGGLNVVVVITDAPGWARAAASGCPPSGPTAPAGELSATGLRGYRELIASLLALGRLERVALVWWSAWNEPNHPDFLAPQRARCDPRSPSQAPAAYAAIVRVLRQTLASGPDAPRIVLGEAAGFRQPRAQATAAAELARALPDDLVCGSAVWAQHVYLDVGDQRRPAAGEDLGADADTAGAPGLLEALEQALDAHHCPTPPPIWITETGVGGPHGAGVRSTDAGALRAECRAMGRALERWRLDPRVDAAIQYSFREDDRFPVGLVDARLTRAYPTYDLWLAWGQRPTPLAPAPALPNACR